MISTVAIPVHQMAELLKLEASAIHQAAERLDFAQIEQSLTLLQECKGKVVLSGVGKSGIVAQKIAATLMSIGTVAFFLHPCEALHGDLGAVTPEDVVILLSNSGETEELVQMLPHLKHRRVPIIALVGNLASTLARQADVVLDASVAREACPLNLAPTTSTTVALAIGDALAMTLMQMRGVTEKDFAINHPAGRLGKRLTLQVKDLMFEGSSEAKLLPSASWLEVVTAITKGGAGAVSIVDDQNRLVGLVTDGDLRRWMQRTEPTALVSLTAEAIMTKQPVAIAPDALAYDALRLMEDRPSQISVLPVVDDQNYCMGLLRLHDLLRSGL
ncbi:KpsF/GutQ family sugar-phosphate isomerase [Thermoleptolyngbya sp. C42_A2020_037]|uniref:KpsF/GutQ family sugar-phosphate isomerase n=1 Tax=Thermoleptolyngbya sp. C42_A2020_037 TaxID=2747799 RepID=UPI0019F66CD1|nr:KpsF/GutQ family sugar-phosphate isomerase [Thermoleptolyngbya sp. C42_A2020_037]MBF2083863.1 KpsF/GutQ family sugar-phosphate isomerase [Thermoleptolyngbya sp. C42_A2020_037]